METKTTRLNTTLLPWQAGSRLAGVVVWKGCIDGKQ